MMWKITVRTLWAALAVLGPLSCGPSSEYQIKEAPDARNRSELMGVPIEKLDNIKAEARVRKVGWSGDYWPTLKGGIADRWQERKYGSRFQDFLYPIKSESELRQMTDSAWNGLSPAEKFDLFQGQLNFPVTRAEHSNAAAAADEDGTIPSWFGLCHGWAPAALLEPDPGSRSIVSGPFGRKITFYSADMKALWTKLYADAQVANYFLGGRCNDRTVERDSQGRAINPTCRDTNPASLHLVLGHFIGKKRVGFVADVYNGDQVWNQPVVGYKFVYTNRRSLSSDRNYRHAAPETSSLVDVDLTMEYLVEGQSSRSSIAPITSNSLMNYTLELDSQGHVIGGEWISSDRPDFLWHLKRRPQQPNDSSLDYQAVRRIVGAGQ